MPWFPLKGSFLLLLLLLSLSLFWIHFICCVWVTYVLPYSAIWNTGVRLCFLMECCYSGVVCPKHNPTHAIQTTEDESEIHINAMIMIVHISIQSCRVFIIRHKLNAKSNILKAPRLCFLWPWGICSLQRDVLYDPYLSQIKYQNCKKKHTDSL